MYSPHVRSDIPTIVSTPHDSLGWRLDNDTGRSIPKRAIICATTYGKGIEYIQELSEIIHPLVLLFEETDPLK